MKPFKKTTMVILAFCLLISFTPKANAFLIQEVNETTLIRGVTYQNIKRLYESGWQDIYVLRADLTQPHLAFEVLKNPQGQSFLQDTFAMAKEYDAIGAVNADFFASKRNQYGRGSAVGVEITDGKLNTTASIEEKMNVLYQLKEDQSLYFNSFIFDITITAPNGEADKIRHINKYDDLNRIVLYNRTWNNLSLGAEYGVIEVVVKDNIVVEKRRNAPPVEIPENGYILTENLDVHTFLDDNLEVGDEVKLDISSSPNFELIETAVGGGGIVLSEGRVPTSFSHNITGYHPRTAVGADETGKILYLVVVDGRRTLSKGMTQTELGYLMADLGCYNAMNLDGGGSTLMAIKEEGEHKVVNTPSDGSYRKVTNSIGITSSAELGKLDFIKIAADSKNVFKNTSAWLWAEGYDEYHQKLEIDQSQIEWTVDSDKGKMVDSSFHPIQTGTAQITATYQGHSHTIEMNVLDKPYAMEFTSDSISLKTGEHTLMALRGRDVNGVEAPIYPKDTDISISNEIAKMEGNHLFALGQGTAVLTAGFGQANANAAIMIDTAEIIKAPENKRIADPMEKAAEDGFKFTVFGNTRTPETLFDLFIMNNTIAAMKTQGQVSAFVGTNVNGSLLGELQGRNFLANGYHAAVQGGNMFITVNNNNGDIFGSDKTQWESLKAQLRSVDEPNIFLFLNRYQLSSNEVEVKALKKMLEDCAGMGKNVMVFAGGYKNIVKVENGVRYVTLGGVFESVGIKSPATNISYVKYLVVSVNGGEIAYEFKNILDY